MHKLTHLVPDQVISKLNVLRQQLPETPCSCVYEERVTWEPFYDDGGGLETVEPVVRYDRNMCVDCYNTMLSEIQNPMDQEIANKISMEQQMFEDDDEDLPF